MKQKNSKVLKNIKIFMRNFGKCKILQVDNVDQCKNYLKNLNSLPNFILKNEMTFPFQEKTILLLKNVQVNFI